MITYTVALVGVFCLSPLEADSTMGDSLTPSRLSEYLLYRILDVNQKPPQTYSQFETGTPLAIEEYDLSTGAVISVRPGCFGTTMSTHAASRWKDISFLLEHGSPSQNAAVEKMVPPPIKARKGRDGCALALLSVSARGEYALWANVCWATSPDCLYAMECFLVNTVTGEIIAEKQFCNCLIRGDLSCFLGDADPFSYIIDRGKRHRPRIVRVCKDGFGAPLVELEREAIAASPDRRRIVLMERTNSQETLVVELRDPELRKVAWKTALTINDADSHPAAFGFWSEDSSIIAISIEGNPGQQDELNILDARDGALLGTMKTDSRYPLSSDVVILQKRGEPLDFDNVLGVKICEIEERDVPVGPSR